MLIVYLFIKRFVIPIQDTDAYKLKLIDNQGKVIKTPKTEEEKEALTLLDRLCFRLRRMLGGKSSLFNRFLFVSASNNDFSAKFTVRDDIQKRAEIIRIKRELEKLSEQYNTDFDTFLKYILVEEVRRDAI